MKRISVQWVNSYYFAVFPESLNSEDDDYDLLSTTVTNVWAFPLDAGRQVYLQAQRQDSCDTNATETIELTDVGSVSGRCGKATFELSDLPSKTSQT